jgi:hypothetical protein
MTSPDHLGTTAPLQDPTTASPWVPLWRIIEQIASAIGDSREAEHYAKTRLYIRQVAAEGRLRIRGRHEIEVAGQERTNFSEIYTEIPPAYWKHSVINVLAPGAAFEADRHTNPEKTPYTWGPKGLYEPNCYTGLQLNSDDVSQLIGDVRGKGLLADARSISTETEPLKFSDVVSLKPALWGMSIDLPKAWKWLREGLHSLGRKQQAMPQFFKTASILNRLWRDPVWSKVIATGITAGIGALVVWYFHTQNPPPPATTPTPAIPAAPPAVTQQLPQSSSIPDHQSRPPLPNPSQNPVVWDRGSQFLVVTGGGPNAQINSVLLQGTSTTSVSIKEAYAVSGLTGHKQELMANVQYKGNYPVDQIDIPPQAPVWLELLFKPPLAVRDFVEQWGQLRVTIIYSDGTTDDLNFDENYVRQKLQTMIPGAFGPHVSPRSN